MGRGANSKNFDRRNFFNSIKIALRENVSLFQSIFKRIFCNSESGYTKVSGKSLETLISEGKISKEKLNQIIQRTRDGGAEIIKFLEKGSAYYAPAASGVEMAESYLKDQKKLLPCAAHLNGEYGVKNLYAGVPVIIGAKGVEKIEELSLNEVEKKQFEKSISAVNNLWLSACKIDPELR